MFCDLFPADVFTLLHEGRAGKPNPGVPIKVDSEYYMLQTRNELLEHTSNSYNIFRWNCIYLYTFLMSYLLHIFHTFINIDAELSWQYNHDYSLQIICDWEAVTRNEHGSEKLNGFLGLGNMTTSCQIHAQRGALLSIIKPNTAIKPVKHTIWVFRFTTWARCSGEINALYRTL